VLLSRGIAKARAVREFGFGPLRCFTVVVTVQAANAVEQGLFVNLQTFRPNLWPSVDRDSYLFQATGKKRKIVENSAVQAGPQE